MTARKVEFNVPFVSGNELDYLTEVIETRRFAGNGPFTKRCQTLLQERYGVPHVLLTHSCTGALELAALALDFGPEDEVIIPSYTFAATASAFHRTGARIIFCEVDPTTMNLDTDHVGSLLTERTRAIVPVHYGGIAADMDSLASLVEGSGISIVEDAAQGLEATLHGTPLGAIGRLGTLSFHETKNLHAGLSGALLVNDPELFDRTENMWERGTNRTKMLRGLVDKYTWVEPGSSFYPSELQAAFLYAQLEAIEENLRQRQLLYDAYMAGITEFSDRARFELPLVGNGRQLNAHSVFIIGHTIDDTERIRIGLEADGVSAYIGYVALHTSPMGARLGYSPGDLPVTADAAPRVLRLPLHTSMDLDDVAYVVSRLEKHA